MKVLAAFVFFGKPILACMGFATNPVANFTHK
jgi:hypothetical protein